MLQYYAHNPEDGGVDKSGFHKNELITCVPLHFCVGKESLDVFRNNFKDF